MTAITDQHTDLIDWMMVHSQVETYEELEEAHEASIVATEALQSLFAPASSISPTDRGEPTLAAQPVEALDRALALFAPNLLPAHPDLTPPAAMLVAGRLITGPIIADMLGSAPGRSTLVGLFTQMTSVGIRDALCLLIAYRQQQTRVADVARRVG